MTKTQWKHVLEELKTLRTTNKFQCPIVYNFSDLDYKIEQVDPRFGILVLECRIILSHADVINIKPNEFKERFYFKQKAFTINTITFK